MNLFEKVLSVCSEDIGFELRGYVNPRRLSNVATGLAVHLPALIFRFMEE